MQSAVARLRIIVLDTKGVIWQNEPKNINNFIEAEIGGGESKFTPRDSLSLPIRGSH